MVDIQDTSLHYFIYMYILQVSAVSTTTCVDHHVFMVSFLSEMNYFPTLAGLFFQWKKKTNKTYQTIYFTYQKSPCECLIQRAISVPDQRAFILLSMILLSKKLF